MLVYGEPGTRRIDMAVLLHTLQEENHGPTFKISAHEINAHPARFFGGIGIGGGAAEGEALTNDGQGLLNLVAAASAIVLTHVEMLAPEHCARLQAVMAKAADDGMGGRARLILTGLCLPEALSSGPHLAQIQLVPLRKHRGDIKAEVEQVRKGRAGVWLDRGKGVGGERGLEADQPGEIKPCV